MILKLTLFNRWSNLGLMTYFSRYLADWVLVFGMWSFSVYLELFTEPFYRHFSINDPTVNFPFCTSEQFTTERLIRLSIILPLCIFTIVHAARFFRSYRALSSPEGRSDLILKSFHSYHLLILSFMIGLSFNGLVTEFLKNLIAKPRPDFIERCGVNYAKVKANRINFDFSICQKPLGELLFKDGFKSSPSGHSSFAFAGLGYLSLWLMGQLKILQPTEPEAKKQYKPLYMKLIPVVPVLLACKIAISRTQDYRHHFKDILLGSAIGIVNCYVNYFWVFNRLDHKLSDSLIFEDDYKLLTSTPASVSHKLESHELNSMV